MEYIKSVALFLVFISFLENIFEFGHMKKYIKLLCGIVLIFILLKPIKEFVLEDFDMAELLKMNEIEFRMAELKNEMNNQDTALGMIEENIRELVWEEGYELTYILVTPDEENGGGIGGISISIKKRNSDIRIERISIEDEMKNSGAVESVRIGEKISSMYGIRQDDVTISIE